MRRRLAFLGLALLALLGALAVSVWLTVRATAPIREAVLLDGVQVVKDGFVSAFLLDLGEREVALVDAGDDPGAAAILAALARRGLGPEAVKAILLTHGDVDHVAGARRFPGAKVMALGPDVALAEGRERRGLMKVWPARPAGLRVERALQDGETLDLSGVAVRVFAVPGHSAGSAAYLSRGVLFLGDSCEATKDGRLAHGWWFSNSDTAEADASLSRLARRLEPDAGAIRAIACGHSAVLVGGLGPLRDLAAR